MTTEPLPADSWQPELEGLTPPRASAGALSKAARATVQALEDDQLLEPRHTLTVQLVLNLADALDRDMSRGKISVAMSQATRQLLDAIEALPSPDAAQSDEWDELARAFAEADVRARERAEAARAAAAGGAA